MPTLSDTLLDASVRPVVVTDVVTLVDAEMARKKGASGLALKAGYGAVRKVSPSIVQDAVRKMLPGFVAGLDPYWDQWNANPQGSFGDYLSAREGEVSDALLSVTDQRIAGSNRTPVKKAYSSLRGSARKHVSEALPQLGELVTRHAA